MRSLLAASAVRSVLRALSAVLVTLFLSVHAFSAAEAEAPVPPGVRHCPDLIYGKVGEQELQLDLACPANGAGPFPAVVILHGGGWVTGSRKLMLPVTFDFAAHGYVAVAVSYRFAPEAPYPAQLQDARCAVRWLRANAARYRIDPDRIGAFGYSSGGHLALLLGTTCDDRPPKETGGHAGQSSQDGVVVACYPPTDLAAWDQYARNGKHSRIERECALVAVTALLGGPPARQAERATAASPITHLRAGAPPTLLIHGLADTMVPLDQSLRYALKGQEVGAPIRLLCLEGAEHSFGTGIGGVHGRRGDDAAIAFFDEHLKASAGTK
jgi:acetyl esterase/lipase